MAQNTWSSEEERNSPIEIIFQSINFWQKIWREEDWWLEDDVHYWDFYEMQILLSWKYLSAQNTDALGSSRTEWRHYKRIRKKKKVWKAVTEWFDTCSSFGKRVSQRWMAKRTAGMECEWKWFSRWNTWSGSIIIVVLDACSVTAILMAGDDQDHHHLSGGDEFTGTTKMRTSSERDRRSGCSEPGMRWAVPIGRTPRNGFHQRFWWWFMTELKKWKTEKSGSSSPSSSSSSSSSSLGCGQSLITVSSDWIKFPAIVTWWLSWWFDCDLFNLVILWIWKPIICLMMMGKMKRGQRCHSWGVDRWSDWSLSQITPETALLGTERTELIRVLLSQRSAAGASLASSVSAVGDDLNQLSQTQCSLFLEQWNKSWHNG